MEWWGSGSCVCMYVCLLNKNAVMLHLVAVQALLRACGISLGIWLYEHN